VKAAVAHLHDLPAGVQVKPYFDQSIFVRASYHGLRKEIVQAFFLIALVILVFLQSARGTLVVAIAIPLSFAITLIVLYSVGYTLNAFTLGGLTLAMGPLVDDTVVVLESIHRHRREGVPLAQAVLDGVRAVALPIFAATMTMIAVLLPVVLLEGLAKKLFAPLALTVAVAMLVSYLVSILVTPLAARYLLGQHREPGRLGRRVRSAIDRFVSAYVAALERALRFRRLVVGGAAALVIVASLIAARLPKTFFPEIDEGMERIYVRVAPGTSLEEATRLVDRVGATLMRELPKGDVEMVLANIGSPGNARSAMNSPNWGPNMGFIRLALADEKKRRHTQQEIAYRSRAILGREFPGVDFLQMPGGLVASVFANGYISTLVVEVRN